jgi:hypothetical protein
MKQVKHFLVYTSLWMLIVSILMKTFLPITSGLHPYLTDEIIYTIIFVVGVVLSYVGTNTMEKIDDLHNKL